MFDTTFFRDDLAMVVHPKEINVTKNLLDDPNATFVWGELMNPHFIKELLGHFAPYAIAELRGYERRRTKTFFNAVPKTGACIQGVVLLGLTKTDIDKLNEFEKIGVVMRRATGPVSIGHYKRRAAMYLKR